MVRGRNDDPDRREGVEGKEEALPPSLENKSSENDCSPQGPSRVHGGHRPIGIRQGSGRLGVGGSDRRLGRHGIDISKVRQEPGGCEGVGPIGDHRADCHDEEAISCEAVTLGAQSPHQGE